MATSSRAHIPLTKPLRLTVELETVLPRTRRSK